MNTAILLWPRAIRRPDEHEPSVLLPVFVCVLWITCAAVGAVGLAINYSRPVPPATTEPVFAQKIEVELAGEAVPIPEIPRPQVVPLEQPPSVEAMLKPEIVPAVLVAEASPAIAFPLPVESPARIVKPAEAAAVPTNFAPVIAAPPAQVLTYGQGEGRQAAPEYPRRAIVEGQEGAVTVRMVVGENGRVLSAEAFQASPWPLLNEAALSTIRRRWQFQPGPVRLYEVTIRFELQK